MLDTWEDTEAEEDELSELDGDVLSDCFSDGAILGVSREDNEGSGEADISEVWETDGFELSDAEFEDVWEEDNALLSVGLGVGDIVCPGVLEP